MAAGETGTSRGSPIKKPPRPLINLGGYQVRFQPHMDPAAFNARAVQDRLARRGYFDQQLCREILLIEVGHAGQGGPSLLSCKRYGVLSRAEECNHVHNHFYLYIMQNRPALPLCPSLLCDTVIRHELCCRSRWELSLQIQAAAGTSEPPTCGFLGAPSCPR
jgi:hypothetical protein